jgi:hypothetical protein
MYRLIWAGSVKADHTRAGEAVISVSAVAIIPVTALVLLAKTGAHYPNLAWSIPGDGAEPGPVKYPAEVSDQPWSAARIARSYQSG